MFWEDGACKLKNELIPRKKGKRWVVGWGYLRKGGGKWAHNVT